MPKKITKLFQNSFNKFYRQKTLMFEWKNENKDFKHGIPELKKSKKMNKITQKNLIKMKKLPEGALLYILRYLSISINGSFSRYPKIGLFWKSFFGRMLREEGILKTSFATLNAKNEVIIPIQSRGLKSTTTTPMTPPGEPSSQDQTKKPDELPKENNNDALGKNDPLTGVEEQKFYTEKVPQKHFDLNLKRNWEETEETLSSEIPPAQKCRLSCPLPPPEFSSEETNEFRSNYQPPSVRFLSLPEQFLPKPTQTTTDIQMTKDSLKNYNRVSPSETHTYEFLPQEIPKMNALLFEPSTLQLKYDAVDAPTKIFKDEILVEVAYSGVCGTDLFITEGKVPCGNNQIILGHEISGTVYAVGKEVDHVKPGDKVAVNAFTACCVCRYCSRGIFSGCLNEGLNNSIGISRNGGWAEFVVVKKSQVHKIPDQLELDQAALTQPLSCILSAMSKLKIVHEMDILIQGLGLTGCLWASVLHSQGHKNVIVCDKTSKRRSEFESLGTNYLLVLPEEVGNYTADLVVECTGSQDSIERSLNVLNPNGQICFFGKPHPVTEIRCFPYEIIQREITIVGNTGNAFHFSKAINMANAMRQRYLDFNKLGVRTFNLENFREAFELKKAEEVSKIMFKFDR